MKWLIPTYILVAIFVMVPMVQAQQYNLLNYNPDYTPYNFEDALDHLDFPQCKRAVDDYDRYSNDLIKSSGIPITIGENVDVTFTILKQITEAEIRNCLLELQKKEKIDSIKACDFNVIDKLSTQDKITHKKTIMECQLDVCDMDAVNAFSGSEKVLYNKEINTCKEKLEPEPEPQTQPKTPAIEQLPQPIVPMLIPAERESIPTIRQVSEPVHSEAPEIYSTEVVEETVETLQLTQEELDKIVQEQIAKTLAESQVNVEEKPSFFKRVINFFFGWF